MEKMNSVLEEKMQEAAALRKDFDAMEAIVEEHSHCSSLVNFIDA